MKLLESAFDAYDIGACGGFSQTVKASLQEWSLHLGDPSVYCYYLEGYADAVREMSVKDGVHANE